jgi:hypothetical protein
VAVAGHPGRRQPAARAPRLRPPLVGDSGDRGESWHERGSDASDSGALLESLAVLRDSRRVDLDSRWMAEGQQAGLLVAVFGGLVASDEPVLARMRHASPVRLAVALDVDRWQDPDDPSALILGASDTRSGAVAMLAARGWRAVAAVAPTTPASAGWIR